MTAGAALIEQSDAVLLDMDGTLVDTESLWFEASTAVAAHFGAVIPEGAGAELHGLDVPALAVRLADDFGLQAEPDEFSNALHQDVMKRLAGAPARRGAGALVAALAASGKKLALVSNSSRQVIEATLAPFAWATRLGPRFSVDDVRRGKPHPDLYLHAASSLGASPERCVVVEDSVAGVTSAVTAGARCIAVTFELEPTTFTGLTDLVVPSLHEVARLLFEDWSDHAT